MRHDNFSDAEHSKLDANDPMADIAIRVIDRKSLVSSLRNCVQEAAIGLFRRVTRHLPRLIADPGSADLDPLALMLPTLSGNTY